LRAAPSRAAVPVAATAPVIIAIIAVIVAVTAAIASAIITPTAVIASPMVVSPTAIIVVIPVIITIITAPTVSASAAVVTPTAIVSHATVSLPPVIPSVGFVLPGVGGGLPRKHDRQGQSGAQSQKTRQEPTAGYSPSISITVVHNGHLVVVKKDPCFICIYQ
jgi:hypothetical protein